VALELPRARRQELAPRDAWQHMSYPELGPEDSGAEATGHVAAPKLS
jgi:hypothetical protein